MKIKDNNTLKKNSIDSLILLRGIAVLMVCFCHFEYFISGGTSFLYTNYLTYGRYGIQVFFVISGFVIPASLFNGKYTYNDYPRFLYKRMLRLHPPYLAALTLTLILMLSLHIFKHVEFTENTLSILKSLIYLHWPITNPVFWTLLIEAEYYFFIGFFFVLLLNYPKISYCIIFPCLLFLGQLHFFSVVLFLYFAVFFFIGNVGFLIYEKIGNRILNHIMLLALLIFTLIFYNAAEFVSAFGTILCILAYRKSVPAFLKFPGKISYSIYLIHYPLGIVITNALKQILNEKYNWLLLISTTIIITIISWVFYQIFEEYAEKLSKKVKYEIARKYIQ